jgi:toxin-antitoxin system PIN domain toxin
MKLLDANILLYAYDRDSAQHEACRSWLETAFNSEEVLGLPWQTLLAFIRITTNPRAVNRPLSGKAACQIVSSWLERPNVSIPSAGERFWPLFVDLVVDAKVTGPLITDTALASLAIEQGASLYSTDRDFHRFKGLKLVDPLEGA